MSHLPTSAGDNSWQRSEFGRRFSNQRTGRIPRINASTRPTSSNFVQAPATPGLRANENLHWKLNSERFDPRAELRETQASWRASNNHGLPLKVDQAPKPFDPSRPHPAGGGNVWAYAIRDRPAPDVSANSQVKILPDLVLPSPTEYSLPMARRVTHHIEHKSCGHAVSPPQAACTPEWTERTGKWKWAVDGMPVSVSPRPVRVWEGCRGK